MGVWGFVTVGRKDVEYQSNKDNLRVTDFIFQSFAKICFIVSCHNVSVSMSKRLQAAQGAKRLVKLTM